ncbi:ubiquitin-conjugating enzyme E2 22-like [Micractinium conductrix]|uniref:E2 ubiquitin-conjugating enzyme n=1 Tax=Micractinium conductrix TaxID=554055 RepID=A0A2P6VRH0_9CHLO|nr:ubiquitin-conjugating enzyme E2 22-like [Micractinium conductrix]|eukprot:PSC76671.1 ubiquitin-conjugating enzyme E2 22-like [Micractinium conductrix]
MEQLSAAAQSKLARDLKDLQANAIDGVKVLLNDDNLADIQAEYEGPSGTPFEGGLFRMRLAIGAEFPNVPPKGYFMTKIFHPNVSSSGEICVNVLKRDWKPDLGLRHVLTVIRCLLIEPNAESALNEEAGKLLLDGFDEFAKKARLMTSIHARKPSSVLTAAGGANAVNADGTAAAADGKPPAGGASGSGSGAGAAKPSKAAAAKLQEKKKSLKRL